MIRAMIGKLVRDHNMVATYLLTYTINFLIHIIYFKDIFYPIRISMPPHAHMMRTVNLVTIFLRH